MALEEFAAPFLPRGVQGVRNCALGFIIFVRNPAAVKSPGTFAHLFAQRHSTTCAATATATATATCTTSTSHEAAVIDSGWGIQDALRDVLWYRSTFLDRLRFHCLNLDNKSSRRIVKEDEQADEKQNRRQYNTKHLDYDVHTRLQFPCPVIAKHLWFDDHFDVRCNSLELFGILRVHGMRPRARRARDGVLFRASRSRNGPKACGGSTTVKARFPPFFERK